MQSLTYLNENYQQKKLIKSFFPVLNELDKNLLELMIYFDEKEMRYFKIIVDNIKSINRALSRIYFDYDHGKTIANKSNEFDLVKDNAHLADNMTPKKTIDFLEKEIFFWPFLFIWRFN